jgi:HPt (histidine-containing phosphotransfer) domain-containing protein
LNVRRSAHVVLTWYPARGGGDAEAFSPLTGERVPLTKKQVAELLEIPQEEFVPCDEDWAADLCRLGLLVSDGPDRRSAELRRRESAIAELGWDFESAAFHLAKRSEGFRGKMAPPAERPSPPFKELEKAATVELPLSEPSSELQGLLLDRRTCRDFDPEGELTIDQLSALLKPERLARAINLYLVESPKLIQKLKQAAATSDAPEIVRSAHSLKSSSGNLGATLLSRYCGDIEASARRADAEEAGKIFAKIETEYRCVETALTAEFELLAASKA